MTLPHTPTRCTRSSLPGLGLAIGLIALLALTGCISEVEPDCADANCAPPEDPTSHASALKSRVGPEMCPPAISFHSVYLTDTLCVCNEGQEDTFSYVTQDGVCEAGCTAQPIATTDDACDAAVATHIPFPNPCSRGCVPAGQTSNTHPYSDAPAFCASELIQHCRPAPTPNPERTNIPERGQSDSFSELL